MVVFLGVWVAALVETMIGVLCKFGGATMVLLLNQIERVMLAAIAQIIAHI